ncbi:hypothetical protein [Bacteroides bouchesdurhonensis]|uniref:hypothetical protein n=1 Tax=Bacteroides bouchesdurhonensis TaxID=1841855 RepID=UPI0022E1A12D|nr:hypothetical protein [Bacteroides bouchesdurhonensis]
MTEVEIQIIVDKVLSSLRTNSLTIEQLTNINELPDEAYFELSGGRKISCSDLKKEFQSFLPGIDVVSSFGDRVDAAVCQAFFTRIMKDNRHEVMPESEYERLAESGKIDPDIFYMTYEEE